MGGGERARNRQLCGAQAMKPALILAALTIATIAGLCALALHPALYPSDATDTGDPT